MAARRLAVAQHICTKDDVCKCYPLATEPNDDCPRHGYPYPWRCGCGRFIKRG